MREPGPRMEYTVSGERKPIANLCNHMENIQNEKVSSLEFVSEAFDSSKQFSMQILLSSIGIHVLGEKLNL